MDVQIAWQVTKFARTNGKLPSRGSGGFHTLAMATMGENYVLKDEWLKRSPIYYFGSKDLERMKLNALCYTTSIMIMEMFDRS